MPTQQKVEQVEELTELFKNSEGCWFVDARGLTVKESQELRRNIREGAGQMHVYKNNLAAIALKNLDLPEIPEILAGPTAFVFCDGDVAAPAKALKDFAKDHEALEIKGGIVDGKVYSVEEAQGRRSAQQGAARRHASVHHARTGHGSCSCLRGAGRRFGPHGPGYRRPEGCIAPRLLCICKVA